MLMLLIKFSKTFFNKKMSVPGQPSPSWKSKIPPPGVRGSLTVLTNQTLTTPSRPGAQRLLHPGCCYLRLGCSLQGGMHGLGVAIGKRL